MWGSYEGGSATWEWAWIHPDIPDVSKQESCAVLGYGAAYIVDAEAAYGGPVDDTVIAFGLRDVQAIKPVNTVRR